MRDITNYSSPLNVAYTVISDAMASEIQNRKVLHILSKPDWRLCICRRCNVLNHKIESYTFVHDYVYVDRGSNVVQYALGILALCKSDVDIEPMHVEQLIEGGNPQNNLYLNGPPGMTFSKRY